jgi:hypothetical protein
MTAKVKAQVDRQVRVRYADTVFRGENGVVIELPAEPEPAPEPAPSYWPQGRRPMDAEDYATAQWLRELLRQGR